ncbi:hypothetical protein P5V15_011325 [Pogonomyrmex californicus]
MERPEHRQRNEQRKLLPITHTGYCIDDSCAVCHSEMLDNIVQSMRSVVQYGATAAAYSMHREECKRLQHLLYGPMHIWQYWSSTHSTQPILKLSRCDQSDDTLSEPMDQVLTRRRGIARLTRWMTHRGPGRLRTRALTETPTLRG